MDSSPQSALPRVLRASYRYADVHGDPRHGFPTATGGGPGDIADGLAQSCLTGTACD